jgi:TonB family protein
LLGGPLDPATVRAFSIFLLTILPAISPEPLLAKARGDPDDAFHSMAAKAGLLAAPMPDYPYAARVAELQGRGLYLVSFDPESGLVREVAVLHSTGYAILDETAIHALHRWRIKPHTSKKIAVPINFELNGERSARLRGSDPNILYAPQPHFPIVAAGLGVNHAFPRHGRFQLNIDPSSGLVTDVKILETTRDWRFDTAAVRAYRQWRFRPHTLTKFIVPIG